MSWNDFQTDSPGLTSRFLRFLVRLDPLRWLRFNLVGLGGMAVQFTTLALLYHVAGFHYLVATAVGVELAVIHNFGWHRIWTWGDRRVPGWRVTARRFAFFNGTTGLVSILGNLIFMKMLVGGLAFPVIPANLISIAGCSILNFLINDRLVFRTGSGALMEVDEATGVRIR